MSSPRFTVEAKSGPIAQLALRDAHVGSELWVAPSRGALATRFFDGSREVFFLDEPSFLDRTKNVRGGNPVLFPTPGKLDGDQWKHAGKQGALKQHGFARNASWTVLRQATTGRASVVLGLESSPDTLLDYPWFFRVELGFALRDRLVRVEIRVVNTGTEPMPYGFGFHPYFRVALADKAGAAVETKATRAWDNVLKQERALSGIALGQGEVDLHLLDHASTSSALTTAAGKVSIEGSPEFKRWVVWTQPEKEFVCLEPWTAPGNALNTGEGLLSLEPGAEQRMWLEYRSS
jgi:galactose mutarotase-like enzyme